MDFVNQLSQVNPMALYGVLLWSLFWKGFSLWRAAKNDQRNWFIAILILNTVGILEIIYLFFFCKKRLQLGELKFWETLKR